MKLTLENARVDESATASLRGAKLRAKSSGDFQGAVISAGYHAKKMDRTMWIYQGNSFGWTVFRVASRPSEYLDPINNTGHRVVSVSPDLTVTFHDVVRTKKNRGRARREMTLGQASDFVTKARSERWTAPPTGGLADARSVLDFPKKALAKGLLVELEHTKDPWMALRIAMDHLSERTDYYALLEQLESAPSA